MTQLPANARIVDLPAGTTPTGSEPIESVQNGISVQLTQTQIALSNAPALSVRGNPTNVSAPVQDVVGTANQVLRVNSAGTSWSWGQVNLASSAAVTGTLPIANAGTGIITYTLGDTLYSDAANSLAKLAGNITTTRKFYRQTGNGAVSAAPVWDTLLTADVPAPGSDTQVIFNDGAAFGADAGFVYAKAADRLGVAGGVRVGFAGVATGDDIVEVGDANFKVDWNAGTAPQVQFDSGDSIIFTRSSNSWAWNIAATQEMFLDASGLQITNGLAVGYAGTPADDTISVGDANLALALNTATPFLQFDSGQDRIQFDRASNVYSVQIGAVNKLFITSTIVAPGTDNAISLGQSGGAWSNLWLGGGAKIDFGAGDVIIQESANNLAFSGATAYTYDSPITVTFSTGGGLLGLMGNAGTDRYCTFYTTGFHPRWTVGENGTAESGANAGSDFFIARWSDADAFIDTPLSIGRASGNISVANTLVASALVSTGSILSTAALSGVGYTTGAGGTVTQITNRTTGVTLNKITGAITTNNASLAAAASASFTVTNSAVAITDTIALSIRSGQTNKETRALVSAVAAASFEITVMNNHASTAETGAIIINFAVIKGVTS